ncbi:hypothetical protein FRUB_02038 [Fimbriiglobus ruber]|uniref:Uncharacterized protein n=1 Tax=Fimbriiglobus ruber TaxID=1908690 RepID=A0A225EBE6_9BACT|nr:hypothetical protein FRUB_02038 [Fimbriiglobus ruber]
MTWKNPTRFTERMPAKSASAYSVNGLAMNVPAWIDRASVARPLSEFV